MRLPTTFSLSGTRVTSSTPFLKALLVFLPLFFIAIFYCSRLSAKDPTSLFFDRENAYGWGYSTQRLAEAEAFIQRAAMEPQPKTNKRRLPDICIGISSMAAHNGAQYFKHTVGSLLDGLTPEERSRLHLVLFVAHTDQSLHPAHGESWMANVADTIMKYDLPQQQIDEVKEMERERGFYRTKGVFDYTYVLEKCQTTAAKHTLILEDDVLAIEGWFHRTMWAVNQAWQQTKAKKENRFLYLRLFYTDNFFGWNSEEWPTYLFYSLEAFTVLSFFLVTGHFLTWKSKLTTAHGIFEPKLLLLYLFGFLPAFILLFFANGRLTPDPLPHGVIEMPHFGCCSQGLLYPRESVKDVIDYLRQRRSGFVDEFVETLGNERNQLRYALVPSILQHIGADETKKGAAKPVKNFVWNFDFEAFNAEELKQEHNEVLERQRNPQRGL